MNIDLNKIPTPSQVSPDDSSFKIAKEESEKNYEQDGEKQKHTRRQRIMNFVHWYIIILIGVFMLCITACIIVRTIHMLVPATMAWLSLDQKLVLDNVAKYAGSGAVGAVLVKFLTKNVDNL